MPQINGFDLVWNILLAPFTLGERNSRATRLGTAVIFVGSVTATLFGPHQSKELSLEELESHFFSMRFIVYVLVFCALFISGRIFLLRRKNQELPPGRTDYARGMLLGIGGGAVGGQSYFLSSAATLVHTNMVDGNWSAWADWLPWVVVGGAIGCALLNARLMDKGLAEFKANFFIPMFAGSAIVAGCVSAIVVLRETKNLAIGMFVMYLFGVFLMMVGLGVLTWDASRVPRTWVPRSCDISPTEPDEHANTVNSREDLESPLRPEFSNSCKSAEMRTIFVETLPRMEKFEMQVNTGDTISSLKEQIQQEKRIPVTKQKLLFAGNQLDNCKRLSDYGIQPRGTVQLDVKQGD